MPAQQTQQPEQIVEYLRGWVEGNRGDLSPAEETFAPDRITHITGSPVPDMDVAGFKQMLTGMLTAFPDLHITIDDQIVGGRVVERWEQWDQPAMMRQLGLA